MNKWLDWYAFCIHKQGSEWEYSVYLSSPLPQVMYYATTEHEMINLPLTHVP